ncbi:MAG: type II/IV secretion system protein [Planctomycetes bacterium]|nr:type II/IV secretion system protein [Planctomycetota bacterium]
MGEHIKNATGGVVGLVDSLIGQALTRRASDIHFEPTDRGLWVRVRCDGLLADLEQVPAALAEGVITRLKVLAGLLTYRQDIPQEGGFVWPAVEDRSASPGGSAPDPKFEGSAERGVERVDLRLATFPTVRGERAVVRLFDPQREHLHLDRLGLADEHVASLQAAAGRSAGLILITGPAGSGKTTTLYSLLGHLRRATPERSVITLEDPVERRLDGIAQIQIQPHGELNYARAMRSLLRQDPEVLMLGEIRDAETASVVVEASLTGHLILSTVHSGDPAETVVRLLEMGVPPYQLVSALVLVCSQRLLRRRCPDGAQSDCPKCNGTGYFGRVAVASLMTVDEEIRSLILERPPTSRLRAMIGRKSKPMSAYVAALVADGVTDENEVRRVMEPGLE